MPNFVSVSGIWKPAKETVTMRNTFGKTLKSDLIVGEDGSHTVKEDEVFIYKGPDREAVKMLQDNNVEYFGQDFRSNPEFLQACRNMGFNSYKEYLESIGYDEEKEKEIQEAKADIVNKHELPKRHAEAVGLAGGRDITGNKQNDVIGGFGSERLRSPAEVKKK